MSSMTLGRTHMTVKVREDKVLYKPKESRTEVEMTGEDSVKMPESWFLFMFFPRSTGKTEDFLDFDHDMFRFQWSSLGLS